MANKSSAKKRKNYMKNWRRQTTKEILRDATVLMFGKYRLKTVGDIKTQDAPYYQWLCKTFKVE